MRPAAEDHAPPLDRDRGAAVDGAEERPRHGAVGVGVAAAAHRRDDAGFDGGRVQQLVEGVLQRDQHPADVSLVAARRLRGGADESLRHRRHRRRACPRQGGLVRRLGLAAPRDRARHGDHEGGHRVAAHRVGVRERAVALFQLCRLFRPRPVRKDAQRARAHQRAVGLAVPHQVADERGAGRVADVERLGAVPRAIGVEHPAVVVVPGPDDRACEGEGHLRIVGGLAGQDPPSAPVLQQARPIGMAGGDLGRPAELHERPQVVARDLPEQAALRTREQPRVLDRPSLGERCGTLAPPWTR